MGEQKLLCAQAHQPKLFATSLDSSFRNRSSQGNSGDTAHFSGKGRPSGRSAPPIFKRFRAHFLHQADWIGCFLGKLQNAVRGQFLDEVLRVLYGLFRGHIKRGVYSCSATYIKVEQSRIARP